MGQGAGVEFDRRGRYQTCHVLNGSHQRSRHETAPCSRAAAVARRVAALIIAMILVGGATRLTNSGLSITEWQPILGVIPPLGEADWQEAFAEIQDDPGISRSSSTA